MDMSIGSFDTLIICGRVTRTTRKFNQQTRIEQVNAYLYDTFGSDLPKSYRIEYYDAESMSFIDLGDHFQNGFNLLQLNPSFGVEESTNINNSIQLFIVNSNSDIYSRIETKTNYSMLASNESLLSEDIDLSENSSAINDTSDDNHIVSLNTDQELIRIPQIIKLEKQENRLFFSRDVKPKQKDIYRSDQFSIRTGESYGRIAHVQGVKTPQQKMLQVLPKIRIPSAFRFGSTSVSLVVTVVSEQIQDGMRIWYKHHHKGFLPEVYGKDTKSMNPVIFDLNTKRLTNDPDFQLNLQMVTKWDKSHNELEEVYRLDEEKTIRIHGAPHDESSPRLLCVLRSNNVPLWDTFCLSDFIQSPKPPKHRSSSAVIPRTCSPKRKRPKTIREMSYDDQSL